MIDQSIAPDDDHDIEQLHSAVPVTGSERFDSIDTLRGIAVLGILVMNIYGFAMPMAAYSNPLAYGGTEWFNIGTWYFTHLIFDQKFMTIFSVLFGAGLIMMSTRAESRGSKYAGVWYRRNFWLLLIGALHGYLIWFGDILFSYALMGMLIFPLRKRKPRTLIIVACLMLPVALLFSYAGGIYVDKLQVSVAEIEQVQESGEELSEEQATTLEEWEAMMVFMAPPEEQVARDLKAYMGNYPDIVVHRAPMVIGMQTQAIVAFLLWRVGGLMLIGMALMKLGVLSAERSISFYRKLMLAGYGIGLPIMFYSIYLVTSHQWDHIFMFRIGMAPNYIGSVFVALGHIALVMLIVKTGALKRLMQRFAAVGRMAFTNYLLHSIILTTVFYGYGFGLYGQIPRLWQMAFVVIVIGLQMIVSPLWLKHYRFGPAEWFWRSLTYWKWQPTRRLPASG
ncbi:MAG: DUF418 domain-containing protein [Gammaproteobacteria bacterium]|nr:MAG: DUF418 domain-containing protein [Gammaproteobacteria bacterium]